MRPKTRLTHVIVHSRGWRVKVHLTPDLVKQTLGGRGVTDQERNRARSAVCKKFRSTFRHVDPSVQMGRVEWHDLKIELIIDTGKGGGTIIEPFVISRPTLQRRCCEYEDCAACVEGRHTACRRGCMLD